MKKIALILMCLILPSFSWAETNKTHEITMTTTQAIQLAGDMVEHGDFDNAEMILSNVPKTGILELEIERWFLLGQISARRGDIDNAIKIFQKILDDQPDLARIRFELAVCYMKKKQWYRADHHLRLAMAGKDLPDTAKQMMFYYRYLVRQNKNWNVWFNFGAAPDNNINNSIGGEECVMTIFGPMCRQLPNPESAIGYNLTLGGNYEFKLSNNWRWKSDASVYTNIYNLHDYDDLYLSGSTGPRYVWDRGDVWLAAVMARRFYGWDAYYASYGAKLELNYDFTRRLSGGASLHTMTNFYDDYGDFLDGQIYGLNTYISYAFNASTNVILRGGLDYENTVDPVYTNIRPSIGIGIGAELPWGFYFYAEPSIYLTQYKDSRWVVKNNRFTEIKEYNITQRYAISVSNNKFDIWGFVPTLTFSYMKRDSNIWQREFDKWSTEFTMRQRF